MFKKFSKKCSIPSSTLGGWHIFGCACLKHKCVTFIAFIISFIFVTTFNITFKIISFFFVIFELSFPSPMALLKWCGICKIHFFNFLSHNAFPPPLNVVGPWSSICRGWSFIESPGWATCACLHRSGEGSLRFPKIKDFVLQIAKIHRGWDHFVHVYALFSE